LVSISTKLTSRNIIPTEDSSMIRGYKSTWLLIRSYRNIAFSPIIYPSPFSTLKVSSPAMSNALIVITSFHCGHLPVKS